MTDRKNLESLISLFDERRFDIETHMRNVARHVGENPALTKANPPIVHSYKMRLKDRQHLRDKLVRKIAEGRSISAENFFDCITDLAGVRVLHLFQRDFTKIDEVVRQKVSDGDWFLAERAKAYTWDPEAISYFGKFDLDVIPKNSYTSVHYLIQTPQANSRVTCELQVRTLFEEIWGEVDHRINYPIPTNNIACREQLQVLSKITGAGSRLLDSIQRVSTDAFDLSVPTDEAPKRPGVRSWLSKAISGRK